MQREAQISALRDWLKNTPQRAKARLLDLGCGDGSVIEALLPLVAAAVGVDHDTRACKAMRKRLGAASNVKIIDADFTDVRHAPRWGGEYDLAICLGHTWMLVCDEQDAVDLLTRIASTLSPHGSFVIDNFPSELWALVEAGDWQTGLSEDSSCQMILDVAEGLVALRYDDEIDEGCERFKESDRLHRLWTMDDLAALASAAGFEPPRVDAAPHLIWFDRP